VQNTDVDEPGMRVVMVIHKKGEISDIFFWSLHEKKLETYHKTRI